MIEDILRFGAAAGPVIVLHMVALTSVYAAAKTVAVKIRRNNKSAPSPSEHGFAISTTLFILLLYFGGLISMYASFASFERLMLVAFICFFAVALLMPIWAYSLAAMHWRMISERSGE